jgi:hypothetical protein
MSGWNPIARLQRYPGPGAPLRTIMRLGPCGAFGRWVLLECKHWREIRDYEILPILGRKRPTRSRCGLCANGYGEIIAEGSGE